MDANKEQGDAEIRATPPRTLEQLQRDSYWESPEARKLFGFPPDADIDVAEVLLEIIALLRKVNEREGEYQLVIPVCDGSNNSLPSNNIYTLRHTSLFSYCPLQILTLAAY